MSVAAGPPRTRSSQAGDCNRLALAGQVCRQPETRYSPSGIPITRFVLEHQSQQQEAGLARHAYCRIEVLAAGDVLSKIARALLPGTPVRVEGFLAERRTAQGNRRLMIHAHALEATN